MVEDYRNTIYCPRFEDVSTKKALLKSEIESKHTIQDLYTAISPNEGTTYKPQFMKVYNHKCCYCGVRIPIIQKSLFEIDHFRNKKHPIFPSEASAGTIDNLVLACRKCNRAKSSFMINDEDYKNLYPDDGSIRNSFVRTDDYYIRVAPNMKGDSQVQRFYKQLKLDEEVRRLDYLLMNMRGLKEKISDNVEIQNLLGQAIDKLQGSRSMMG